MKSTNFRRFVVTTVLSVAHASSAIGQTCCAVPTHEWTYTEAPYDPPRSIFKQEVYNSNINFNGSEVREGNGDGGISWDGCHFPGSAITRFESVTSGSWVVGGFEVWQSNYWGFDHLGWSPPEISYYRVQRPARNLTMPCNTEIIQSMEMKCANVWLEYTDSNVLTLWIGMTNVTNCRTDIANSACNTQNYP
jgi:hypothetical protein